MSNERSEIEGLRALDAQVIINIHNRYYPEVYRYAQYRLNDPISAEDIAAEVFIRLLEAAHNGRGPRSSLRGWLMGTVANLVNEHYRQMYAHPNEVLSEEWHADADDPVNLAEVNEHHRVLYRALTQLTAEQQHVLTLRFGNGYSLEETALIMGKNTNAIKALQFRALAALRKLIGDDW
jgi:RNA polymerase sigma-70 factor (ECF subfamily)